MDSNHRSQSRILMPYLLAMPQHYYTISIYCAADFVNVLHIINWQGILDSNQYYNIQSVGCLPLHQSPIKFTLFLSQMLPMVEPLQMVPMVGLEPTRRLRQRILNPPRLPIPPHRHCYLNLVGIEGLEPPRLSAARSKRAAATNYTISPLFLY